MATYFQVPDDRVLRSPASKIPDPWPANPAGYRLFVSGDSGKERIGIQVGQKIELQIVGVGGSGKDLYLETNESMLVRNTANIVNMSGDDTIAFANSLPARIVVSALVATTDKQKFDVRAKIPGSTALYAFDPSSKTVKAQLDVVVGKFENHPGMSVEVCRGSDSLKIHALQRMLNNNTFLRVDPTTGYNTFNNGDNVFEQHADPNISPDPAIGGMSCGVVARWRTEEVFSKIIAPDFDWYIHGAIHEPLSSRPTNRKQVKYRSTMVEWLRAQILKALGDGFAVRVAVVDDPTAITPQNGALVAYSAGGHTIVIVGCNANGTEFLYIDPWGGGSQMEYKGGIPGAKFPGACLQIGKLIVASDPDRRAKPGDTGNNIIREHPDTQGTFKYTGSGGNYLEVVAGPFKAPGR